MSKKIYPFWVAIIVLSLILAGCTSQASSTPTPVSPGMALTAAVETAKARIALTQQTMPTNTPLPPSPTVAFTPVEAVQTAAVQTAQALITQTPVVTLQPSPTTGYSGGVDNSSFTMKETIPDYTDFDPGEAFTKSWQFLNTGQTTWTTAYSLVFVSGDQIGGPASVALTLDVSPNQVVDIPVSLVAPTKPGMYKGFWRLRNPAGEFFGSSVWVLITVGGGGGTPVITPGSGAVTDVTISVDDTTFQGSCPHTFTFTAIFTLNGPASVTYQLEAGGFAGMTLPPAQTATYGAGTYELVYYLEITGSGSGWARMHITAPNDEVSNEVTFSLVCQ